MYYNRSCKIYKLFFYMMVINKIINKLYKESNNNLELISKALDSKINNNATNYYLRSEMLNLIPAEFWTEKKKILIIDCGNGGFCLDVFRIIKKQSNLTNKEILKECLYFTDSNPDNIYITKRLLDRKSKYKLNGYMYPSTKIKYDLIITNTLKRQFNRIKLTYLNPDSYILNIDNPLWRKNKELIRFLCKKNTMLFLSLNNKNKGLKYLYEEIPYDYYLIQIKKNKDNQTLIKDYDENMIKLNLMDYTMIPNVIIA